MGQPNLAAIYIKDLRELQMIDVIDPRSGTQDFPKLVRRKGFPDVRYRIYRSKQPITAANIASAEPAGEIGPLQSYDESMRIISSHGEYYDKREVKTSVIPTYCIADNRSVPPGEAFYVHTAQDDGKYYYAVTVALDGTENLADVSDANSLPGPAGVQPRRPAPAARLHQHPQEVQGPRRAPDRRRRRHPRRRLGRAGFPQPARLPGLQRGHRHLPLRPRQQGPILRRALRPLHDPVGPGPLQDRPKPRHDDLRHALRLPTPRADQVPPGRARRRRVRDRLRPEVQPPLRLALRALRPARRRQDRRRAQGLGHRQPRLVPQAGPRQGRPLPLRLPRGEGVGARDRVRLAGRPEGVGGPARRPPALRRRVGRRRRQPRALQAHLHLAVG